jgi:Carboxypeptidase regulatory-like domain/TonB dependent receptor
MRQSMRVGLVPLLLVGILGVVEPAWSQEVSAAITGTVTDPNGAVIKGAEVTAIDTQRGTTFTAGTNDSGVFNIERLPVGTYQVKVSAPNFQTAVHSPFTLVLNQTARVDTQMKVGSVTESVVVTGATPLLQTQSAEVSTIIDANTNVSLPLASRNYVQLTLLSPGAVTPNPQGMVQAQTAPTNARPYINGNREQANSFLIDGIDNQESINNEVGYQPSVDAIEEFNVITQNASAQFGQFQGGIINATIKSGTNSYHGDVFEFFRNDFLNANSWQNGLTGLPRPKMRWNMFGGSFGGPILKNKLFFFADYQAQRFDFPQTANPYQVFTDRERAGDFGQLCPAGFDGAGNCTGTAAAGNTQLVNPTTGKNIPNNNLAAAGFTINPIASALFGSSKYPHAQLDTATSANFFANIGHNLNVDQGDVKIDYQFTTDRLTGRYSQFKSTNPFTQTYALGNPTNPTFNDEPGENLSLAWSHTFHSGMLNEVRGGYNHVKFSSGFSDQGLGNFSQSLGIPDGNSQGSGPLHFQFANPGLDIGSNDIRQFFGDGTIQGSDTLIIPHGHHLIHTGFQYWRLRQNSGYSGNDGVLGHINFDSATFTTSDAANFWLGDSVLAGRGGPPVEWGMRGSVYGAFIQDDWRITSNLTLNLGVRYELHTPFKEIHNRMVNFGLFSGAIQVAGQNGNSDTLVDTYNGIGNWQPRIGFAWTPPGRNGKTVVRGAYTVASYAEGLGSNLRLTQNRPFVPSVSAVGKQTLSTTNPAFGPAAPACTGANDACYQGARIFVWDPHFRPAMAQQWNLAVQQVLSPSATFQIGYVGQRGTHLAVPEIITQRVLLPNGTTVPGPYLAGNPALYNGVTGNGKTGLPAAIGTFSGGNQTYNALQSVLQKRMSNGLQGQVAYTYSKCMTDSTGYYGAGWGGTQSNLPMSFWQDIYNRKAEWGPCYFDRTHVLTSYVTYQLPFGHGKPYGASMNRAANAVVGGWEVGGIISLWGGNALTAGSGFSDNSGTLGSAPFLGTRGDCIGTPSYPKTNIGTAGIQWITQSNVAFPAAGTFGDCRNGSFRGPGLRTVDFSVLKDIPLGETRRFEFRAEFINAFNHPILNAPQMFVTATTFGQISTSQGERNIQFALKFYF